MEVKSQIKAIVWKVLKETGDTVKIDDEIVILESMKMEIPISSEFNGKIKSIEVSEGDEVDEGQVVAIIE
ncbi:MAG: biotin/lipoyl-binding carrier protein [Hyphomicrobiales bacterium]|mgnify:FL=1|jgi:acetyl-CoA carboxylase biotin carboxyl carrier protein|nr:biotin/lipoyl-binding carrier protein [Hyphomicrobiales bacterium]|tara:strand:+ start:53 stop:262 length:210 start_codon:yes stop_codon:yes gene_type:complete